MAGKANLEELRGIRLKRIVYLQGKVHRHKVAIRIHIFLSCASITLGLAGLTTTLTIYGWILIDKGLLSLYIAFVASVAAYPIKDISSKKDKIADMVHLQQGYEDLLKDHTLKNNKLERWLEERFNNLFDKGGA